MTNDETQVFLMLDEYSRKRHNCNVTEFFRDRDQSEYFICFRPMSLAENSRNRYACEYVKIGIENVAKMASEKALAVQLTQELDQKLAPLGQLI